MAEHKAKILMTEFVTHDVKRFIVQKPIGYNFTPGQATDVAVDKDGWRDKRRPFTFTSLNEDWVLEFTVKEYPEHDGVTEHLHELKPGDNIIVEDPWGTIHFEGKGIFLAAGAGITPFIAILRDLRNKKQIKGNRLFFSNKERKDVIIEKELRDMFIQNPEDLKLTLTREDIEGYDLGRIDEKFLKKNISDFTQNFYVCGPPKFVKDMTQILSDIGAENDSIVIEE